MPNSLGAVKPAPTLPAWGGEAGDPQIHLSRVEEMPDLKGGVKFLGDTQPREDFGVPVRAAFCQDPSGNVIELTDVAPLDD